MNGLQYALGQIGSRAARSLSLLMLLDERELPDGDWFVLDERSWRSGTFRWFSPESRRSRHAGGFTAVRSFKDIVAPKWLYVEVVPVASSTDAASMVPKPFRRGVPNRKSIGTVTKERKVEDQPIPGVPNACVYEKMVTSPEGSGVARYVTGNVDHILFAVGWSRFGEEWPWDDVVSVAAAQALKIRRTMGAPL